MRKCDNFYFSRHLISSFYLSTFPLIIVFFLKLFIKSFIIPNLPEVGDPPKIDTSKLLKLTGFYLAVSLTKARNHNLVILTSSHGFNDHHCSLCMQRSLGWLQVNTIGRVCDCLQVTLNYDRFDIRSSKPYIIDLICLNIDCILI